MNNKSGITLEDIKRYILNSEEDDDDLEDLEDKFEDLATYIGEILLNSDKIDKEELQYFEDKIDWIPTMNDLLVYASEKEKKDFFEIVKKQFENKLK